MDPRDRLEDGEDFLNMFAGNDPSWTRDDRKVIANANADSLFLAGILFFMIIILGALMFGGGH